MCDSLGILAVFPGFDTVEEGVHQLRADHRQHDFIEARNKKCRDIQHIEPDFQPVLQACQARIAVFVPRRHGQHPGIGFHLSYLLRLQLTPEICAQRV
ncbi:hypothetical protein D9M71_200800 [compost metagenome]